MFVIRTTPFGENRERKLHQRRGVGWKVLDRGTPIDRHHDGARTGEKERRRQAGAGKPVAVTQIPAFAAVEANVGKDQCRLAAAVPRARMRPLASIEAEMPVFAAMTIGRRHSTVRNTPQARCCSNSLEPQNQPSFVTLTRICGSWPSCRNVTNWFRITWGNTVS